ncbi:MAG: preprotein translocase subunit SecG [Desulfobacteraceae bacterium]
MIPIILVLHICVCIALILIVLVQKGKGAGMGAAFGGSSQTVFGSAGATTLLHKVTTVVAVIFMLTSLGLSFFIGRGGPSSIMEDVTPTTQTETQAPAPTQGRAGETQQPSE